VNHLQIAYFLAVAKYGSFSEAARRLFVAQSAISKQIITLETKLGMRLFVRDKRKIELTQAGEILYRELQKYNDWLEQAINMARLVDQGKTGVLNIGIQHGLDLIAYQLKYFSNFSNEYPGIQTNVKRVSLQEHIPELYLGTIDLLLTFAFLIPNVQDLSYKVLGREKDYLVVSRSHPLGKLEKPSPKNFGDYTFVTIEPTISQLAYINSINYLKSVGITPTKVIHVPSIEDIMLAIEFGLGYGVSCKASRLSDEDATVFIDVSKGKKTPIAEIVVAYKPETENPALKAFLDYFEMSSEGEGGEPSKTE